MLRAGLPEAHPAARGQAVGAVVGQILRPGVWEAADKGLQLLQDAHAQPAAVRSIPLRPQGGGHVLQPLGGKIRPALAHVHPHAHDHIVRLAALPQQGQLREDAAQLPAIEIEVVEPLNLRRRAAGAHDAPAHRHRRPAGEGEKACKVSAGPQQRRQIQPRPPGGVKPPPLGAPAAGLLLGKHHRPLRRPGGPQGLQPGVGGVHHLFRLDFPGKEAARPQPSGEIVPAEARGVPRKDVPPPGCGLDGPARGAQGLHLLPHSRPGHAEPPADLLAGEIALRARKQLQNLSPLHVCFSPHARKPPRFSPFCQQH